MAEANGHTMVITNMFHGYLKVESYIYSTSDHTNRSEYDKDNT